MPATYTVLMLLSGLLWTSAYIMIIRRGFIDKTYGMPLAALSANIAWEFIFSFIYPHDIPQVYVNRVWLAFDCVIVYQYVRYGYSEMKNMTRPQFAIMTASSLLIGLLLILYFTDEFHELHGAYTAFGQNLMMSILFIAMLHSRQSLRGQSIYIAICKCLGTIAPSLAYFLYEIAYKDSHLMYTLYSATAIIDAIYIGYVYVIGKREGINPWKRA